MAANHHRDVSSRESTAWAGSRSVRGGLDNARRVRAEVRWRRRDPATPQLVTGRRNRFAFSFLRQRIGVGPMKVVVVNKIVVERRVGALKGDVGKRAAEPYGQRPRTVVRTLAINVKLE